MRAGTDLRQTVAQLMPHLQTGRRASTMKAIFQWNINKLREREISPQNTLQQGELESRAAKKKLYNKIR